MTASSLRRSPALAVISMVLVALWVILAAFPFIWTLWGSFKV